MAGLTQTTATKHDARYISYGGPKLTEEDSILISIARALDPGRYNSDKEALRCILNALNAAEYEANSVSLANNKKEHLKQVYENMVGNAF